LTGPQLTETAAIPLVEIVLPEIETLIAALIGQLPIIGHWIAGTLTAVVQGVIGLVNNALRALHDAFATPLGFVTASITILGAAVSDLYDRVAHASTTVVNNIIGAVDVTTAWVSSLVTTTAGELLADIQGEANVLIARMDFLTQVAIHTAEDLYNRAVAFTVATGVAAGVHADHVRADAFAYTQTTATAIETHVGAVVGDVYGAIGAAQVTAEGYAKAVGDAAVAHADAVGAAVTAGIAGAVGAGLAAVLGDALPFLRHVLKLLGRILSWLLWAARWPWEYFAEGWRLIEGSDRSKVIAIVRSEHATNGAANLGELRQWAGR